MQQLSERRAKTAAIADIAGNTSMEEPLDKNGEPYFSPTISVQDVLDMYSEQAQVPDSAC